MKLLVLLLSLIPAVLISQPKQLFNFQDILAALESGHNIAARFDYEKCELLIDGKNETPPAIKGGMEIHSYEFFDTMSVNNPLPFLSFSETVLINHPRRGFVHNYVKVRIYGDNRVEIRAMYLTPGTLEIVMDETFRAKISSADEDSGAKFYKNQ